MPETRRPIRRALLSVSDKTGLVDLAQFLSGLGVQLLSICAQKLENGCIHRWIPTSRQEKWRLVCTVNPGIAIRHAILAEMLLITGIK